MTESSDIPVVIAGANGRMGRQCVQAILQQVDLVLVSAYGKARGVGEDVGVLSGGEPCGIILEDDAESAIAKAAGGVMIDFTLGQSAKNNVLTALRHDVACVVGVTAIPPADEQEMAAAATRRGVLICPNFALGAVLMMKFAKEAAKYFKWAEIIEYHHERKLDAPSGTALATAEKISRNITEDLRDPTTDLALEGARGAKAQGNIPIHSVRMEGMLAHQEVIFGTTGQTLTIRQDSSDRSSFMPGVLMAIKGIPSLTGVNIGLETLMDV